MKFGYEPWSDVLVFNYEFRSYVVQGRKHKRTRAVQFRVAGPSAMGKWCDRLTVADLKAAGLWSSPTPAKEGE